LQLLRPKLTIPVWHLLTKNGNYLWARPALHAGKLQAIFEPIWIGDEGLNALIFGHAVSAPT
jgi:hypothetical protein